MPKKTNIFKIIFSKTFLIIFALIFCMGIFFYWGWFVKQYDKCLGMYYVYKGDKAYKQAKLQNAIDYYNKGLELFPNHYGAWFNLGNIYVVYEDYYAAASAYEKAIEYNNTFTLARMNLGIVSTEKLGDFNGAIAQYNEIINTKKHLWSIPFIFNNKTSEKTNKGLAYYNMGVTYREKSIYEHENKELSIRYLLEAIEAYKHAAKILKNDYDTRYNLALAYHLSGDYQNAGLSYCKAIELKPMDYSAHYNLAVLLRHLKLYKEAYSEIEKASILISNSDDSNTNTSTYIFDILNEVSRTLVVNDEYRYLIEHFDDTKSNNTLTYVNGKIVATDELDKAMLKNLKTCESKSFFEEYQ